MHVINPFILTSYHPKYQAVLNYATANAIPHPSTDVKNLQNIVMQSLDDEDILDLLDVFHLKINDVGLPFLGINLANPEIAYVSFRDTNWEFLSKVGIRKLNSSQANVAFNMKDDSINYQLGSCAWFYKLGAVGDNNIASGDFPVYCSDGTNLIRNTNGTSINCHTNHTSPWSFSKSTYGDPSIANSFNVFSQNASSNKWYQNGVLKRTQTAAAVDIPDAVLQYGTSSGAYTNIHELGGTCGLLTDAQVTAFNTIIDDYKTAIAAL